MHARPFPHAGRTFQEGASAREGGMRWFDNPYGSGTPEQIAWITGWRAADEELAEDSQALGALTGPLPFDLPDFRCAHLDQQRIEIVFTPMARRYTFFRQPRIRDVLHGPVVAGDCGEFESAVVDCLARAVAYLTDRRARGATACPDEQLALQEAW